MVPDSQEVRNVYPLGPCKGLGRCRVSKKKDALRTNLNLNCLGCFEFEIRVSALGFRLGGGGGGPGGDPGSLLETRACFASFFIFLFVFIFL